MGSNLDNYPLGYGQRRPDKMELVEEVASTVPTTSTGGKQKNTEEIVRSEDGGEWTLAKKVCRVANQEINFTVSTANSFSIFSEKNENDQNSESVSTVQDNTNTTVNQRKNPPPIVVSGVASTIQAVEDLKAAGFHSFQIQKIRDGVRIYPETLEMHSNIKEYLIHRRSQFHTYSSGNQPLTQKFVIYGLDVDHDIEAVKTILNTKLGGILDVRRLRKSDKDGRKTILPLILITTTMDIKIKQIEDIRHFNRIMFTVKPYIGKRCIVQCYRCQQFGHTKNHCGRTAVCVRCAGPHRIEECPRATALVKCANCNEAHVASFTGCKVRQEIQERVQRFKEKIGLKKTPTAPTEVKQRNQQHHQIMNDRAYPTLPKKSSGKSVVDRAHHPQGRTQQTDEYTYANVARHDVTPPWVENIMSSIRTLTETTNQLLTIFTQLISK